MGRAVVVVSCHGLRCNHATISDIIFDASIQFRQGLLVDRFRLYSVCRHFHVYMKQVHVRRSKSKYLLLRSAGRLDWQAAACSVCITALRLPLTARPDQDPEY